MSTVTIQLPESDLDDPMVTKSTDRRLLKPPYIYKKILKDRMLEVACKPVKMPDHQKLQARLLIMRRLKDSPYIMDIVCQSATSETLESAVYSNILDVIYTSAQNVKDHLVNCKKYLVFNYSTFY